MMIGAGVSLGLPVEVSVFYINARSQTHVSRFWKLLASRLSGRRPVKAEDGCIVIRQHLRADLDFHRAPVSSVSNKMPNSRGAGIEPAQIPEIERREKAIGVNPNANTLGKNVPVYW
jgi:hypothetical protein